MIFKNTEIVIYLGNALPEELLLSLSSKKVIVKAVKKRAAKKAIQRKQLAKKGTGAKNKKARNRLIVAL
jgi:chromosome condensin MukBEF MukE localization factor